MQPWMLSSKSTPARPEVATTRAAALTLYSGQVYDPESFITPGMFPKFESSEMIVILCLCMILGGKLTLGQKWSSFKSEAKNLCCPLLVSCSIYCILYFCHPVGPGLNWKWKGQCDYLYCNYLTCWNRIEGPLVSLIPLLFSATKC